MKLDIKHYLIFQFINILLNCIGWYFSFDRVDNAEYPNNLKDVFGMIFWSSLFQLLIFIKWRKVNFLILYILIILFIPRFFLYYSNSFYSSDLMEIVNSSYGIQVLWIEPLYSTYYQMLNYYIERYILYFFMITLQIIIIYSVTKRLSKYFFERK
jgi:hypothetical protein